MRNKIHSFRIKIVQLLFAIVCAISYHNHVEFIEKKTIRAGDMGGLKFVGVVFLGNFYHCFWCLEYVREGDAGSIDKKHYIKINQPLLLVHTVHLLLQVKGM
jgi:hypothetical protein